MNYHHLFLSCMTVALVTPDSSVFAGNETDSIRIPTEDRYWTFENTAAPTQFEGRPALHLDGNFAEPGIARIRGLEFSDGIIEFDMYIVMDDPVFCGIEFRKADGNWEYLYFRPGANNQYNCFQYYPHVNDQSTWQLYGQHQRQVDLPHDNWFHLRIEVSGTQMACYLNQEDLPFFYTPFLQSESPAGEVQFVTSSECYLSNVRITHQEPTHPDYRIQADDLHPSYLTRWEVTPAISVEEHPEELTPGDFSSAGKPQTLQAESQGLINFSRHIDRKSGHDALMATTVIESEVAQKKLLRLAYSDRLCLFLNGKRIFKGDNTFRTEDARMRSRVHLDNDQVELPLIAGKNLLQAIVYERFGGWGLMARLENLDGIESQ